MKSQVNLKHSPLRLLFYQYSRTLTVFPSVICPIFPLPVDIYVFDAYTALKRGGGNSWLSRPAWGYCNVSIHQNTFFPFLAQCHR